MWSGRPNRRRFAFRGRLVGVALLAASGIATAHAQVVSRDTAARLYRLRARQLGDTNYLNALQRVRLHLQIRLDSLQRELEDMSVDSPDRAPRLREITALLSSIANLSELEQVANAKVAARGALGGMRQRIRALAEGEALTGTVQLSDASLPRGWIGINVEAPHQRMVVGDTAFIRYFSYPEIVSVEPDSPAERAGISRGDRLVAYNGADVRDREINLTKLLQPARRITVTVRRDGEDRELPLVVARAPARFVERRVFSLPVEAPAPRPPAAPGLILRSPSAESPVRAPSPMMMFGKGDGSSAAMVGANLSEIRSEELGQIFGVASGLLVTEVFSDPAESAGLKGGDVIVAAEGQDLTRLAQLRRLISAHNDDRSLEVEVVRRKRTRMITLRW